MNWKIETLSPHSHIFDFEMPYKGEQWVLLMSDEHWDNAMCNRSLLKRHHEMALERKAPIFKFGDTFCAMQGKWDRRADQEQIRSEHRGNNYLDRLKHTATEWYGPFKKNIALISTGNHEQSILDRHQTDLVGCLAHDLSVNQGAYWGFVTFRGDVAGKKHNTVLHYHHGYGGGGEVTRGLIDHSRTRGQYTADIYVSGHIHRRNYEENIITECVRGAVMKRRQLFLRCGTYKDEDGGWHAAQGRASRPLGGWWVRFFHKYVGRLNCMDYEATPAT